jgi:hypothetical protein
MQITQKTREQIADLILKGYNKGIAEDGEGQIVVFNLFISLDR